MIDRNDEYRQALLEIENNLKSYVSNDIYKVMFEKQIEKMRELLNELDDLPDEVNYKSENDNHRLRAFIKEELRRNKLLEIMVGKCIFNMRLDYNCPPTGNCKDYDEELCQEKNCLDCWFNHLRWEAEKEMKN